MRIPRTFLASFICLFASGFSNAEIIEGNVSLFRPGWPGEYQLTVFQDPPGEDPTSIWFNFSGSTLVGIEMNLDEGSDWYWVPFGTEFTAESIAASNFPFLTKVGSSGGPLFGSFAISPGTFYLGVNTGTDFDDAFHPKRDIFGWAEFFNHGSDIHLVSSALGYKVPGIIIGTTIAVPEPSGLASLGISMPLLLIRRYCRASRTV